MQRLFVVTAIEADQDEVKQTFSSEDFNFMIEAVQYVQDMCYGGDEDDYDQATAILAKFRKLKG